MLSVTSLMPNSRSVLPASDTTVQVVDLAGHQICDLEIPSSSTGRDIKQEIARSNHSIKINSQRLVGDAGILHDWQILTEYCGSSSTLLLTVVRLPDEITTWLESIEAEPLHVRALFRTASDNVRSSWECAWAAVIQDGLALQFADPDIRANRDIAFAAIKDNGLALMYVGADLAKDPEVVMTAVRANGMALEFACEELQNARPTVAAAMRQDVAAFQFAGPSLQQDCKLNCLRVVLTCRLYISNCPSRCTGCCMAQFLHIDASFSTRCKKPRAQSFCAVIIFLVSFALLMVLVIVWFFHLIVTGLKGK